ncbi:glycoside hydrolase [Stachybotrys elegans]|uniref:Glucanase n=1 Tax=Stachybotrys elegans TaxID=80388 RepID=A0A8K0WYB1_9HYPO|nr:glycoside hydrolase [Stachybotrys elegans]
MHRTIAAATALIAAVRAQQVCELTPETHPSLSWSQCTASGCSTVDGSIVIDANWRWLHTLEGYDNCYTGNEWDTSICTDGEVCAQSCCLDGAEYESTYGISTSGDALSLRFVTGDNVGSRTYLMEDENTYQMFTLLGNEFTFDVDVSGIGCGLNGALYFVSMDEDGGLSKYPDNAGGAKYGTGYCDSQCPRDVKFINGIANSEGWTGSNDDANAGVGDLGTCCAEMDIWEANGISTAYTPHPCRNNAQHSCNGDDCGGTYSPDRYAGDCDPDGCDFNAWRQGNETFYGPGSEFTIDTTKPLTVVTQFLAGDDGNLSEIKRFYVQDGVVVANAESNVEGVTGNSVTQDYCDAQKAAFGDEASFNNNGGLAGMSEAVAAPMVLVMSLWNDHNSNMLWLDSNFPVGETGPGTSRGSCPTDGDANDLVEQVPDSTVIFSNIKFGPIGSTFDAPA